MVGQILIKDPTGRQRAISIEVGQTCTLGRGSQADVVVLDREVSRAHCSIQNDGSRCLVQDLESLNGTYLNGKRVKAGSLRPGDSVRIGGTDLEFQTASTYAVEMPPALEEGYCAKCGTDLGAESGQEPVAVAGKPYCAECAASLEGMPLRPEAGPPVREISTVGEEVEERAPLAPGAPMPLVRGKTRRVDVPQETTVQAFLQKHPKDAANRVATFWQKCWYLLVFAALFTLLQWDWLHFLHLTHLLCAFYLVVIVYKLLMVFLATIRRLEIRIPPEDLAALKDEDLPVYTVLVPLYKETEVADKIIRASTGLDYPADKLDIKLLLEPDDKETIRVCEESLIPACCEVIVVPPSMPKTKPKACNHGLTRARGEYLVIYDAEDRPEPDQLKKAVLAFRRARKRTICMQAKLNYYNPRQNFLTKWFTIEYTTWFDLFLPGLHALRAPIPLGGTSNHFKTEVLREIGGWDPFNVTEDCDLGIRLHRLGYRTQVIDSTTWEEANSRVGNWIRQRSRWVKGYIQTHLVHMRRPFKTFWELNPWGFLSFLICVGGLSLMLLLNPLFWVAGLTYLGLWAIDLHDTFHLMGPIEPNHLLEWIETWIGHTTAPGYDRWHWQMLFTDPKGDALWNQVSVIFFIVTLVLLAGNFFFIGMHVLACFRRNLKDLIIYALLSPLYWILISIAAWKGFLQLFTRPFYWEKTVHGLDKGHDVSDSLRVGAPAPGK